MKWVYNDGGRAVAGYKGDAGDCVTRAIAIATGLPYQQVYDAINEQAKGERKSKRRRGRSSARNGVHRTLYRKYLADLGWRWVPTMFIGQGCKVHLADGELPMGRLIVSVSKHLVAVIDGVINDTHDPQRQGIYAKNGVWFRSEQGTRCVYGYFIKD